MSRCEFCGLLLKNRQKRFCSKRSSSRDINKKRFGVKNKKMCKKCGKDLVGDINDLSNLRYLCPNHHVLLDRNLMDKDTILKKKINKPE